MRTFPAESDSDTRFPSADCREKSGASPSISSFDPPGHGCQIQSATPATRSTSAAENQCLASPFMMPAFLSSTFPPDPVSDPRRVDHDGDRNDDQIVDGHDERPLRPAVGIPAGQSADADGKPDGARREGNRHEKAARIPVMAQ